jgi:hypothetical protein
VRIIGISEILYQISAGWARNCRFFLIERLGPRPGGFAAPGARRGELINRIRITCAGKRGARSARMAGLSAGELKASDVYRARSIIGSEFVCRIPRRAQIRGRPAIIPAISSRGWITGVSQYMLDPEDPWTRATACLTLGRASGRQFERLARFARLG